MGQVTISEAICKRHCKRKFLAKKVDPELINKVLLNAGNAGSSKNSQPWKVSVLTNPVKDNIVNMMCKKFDNNIFEEPDYTYMTEPIPIEFKNRAKDCGFSLYKLKGINKNDTKERTKHFRENYTFFDAPIALILHLHENAEKGNFLDIGLFLQNIMLGLIEYGLGSCPQFSICSYSKSIKKMLSLPSKEIIVCSLAIGYPDSTNKVNTFIPKRVPLNDYVTWFTENLQ